jgi:hypothetical protein
MLMNATVTRFALAMCAAIAIACNGGRDAADSTTPPPTATPGEAAATSGTSDEPIRTTGCVTLAQPDGYMLTSLDDAIVRQMTDTSAHHADNPKTRPTDPNRGAEQERARHEQNVSAEAGRFRLAGDTDRIRMHVDREVEITGRFRAAAQNETPATLEIESIDATGASCGRAQADGNDRGILPTQDLPRKR